MSFRTADSEGSGRLLLRGNLTIEHAGEIKKELLSAFEQTDRLVLAIESNVIADLSFLQLLCAAHRTACKEKKTFEVDSSAASTIRGLMQEAGCQHAGDGFWNSVICCTAGEGGENVQEDHDGR